MATLFYDGLVEDIEAAKSANGTTHIVGSRVYQSEFLRAIAEHGTFDAYYLAAPDPFNAATGPAPPAHLTRFTRVPTTVLAERLAEVPDLVFASAGLNVHTLASLRHSLRRASCPIVGITHSLHGPFLLPVLSSAAVLLREHDALVCSSEAGRTVIRETMAMLEEMGAPSPRFGLPVIPLGVHCPPTIPARAQREAACRLLYLGRLSFRTKADLTPLLIAIAKLRAQGTPPVALTIAGDDTVERVAPTVEAIAKEVGVADRVRVMPNVSRQSKQALLDEADVFVAPADHVQETFGLAVAEAMAHGLPVVAADWSGYRDLVRDGQTGLLVPTYLPRVGMALTVAELFGTVRHHDLLARCTVVAPDDLASSLRRLIEDRALRLAMGAEARRVAQRELAWPSIIRAYEALWRDLREAGRRQPATNGAGREYSYDRIFRRYATALLSDDTYVRRADAAIHPMPAVAAEGRFDPALLAAIVRGSSADARRVGDLVQEAAAATQRADACVRLHLARLVKCGHLAIAERGARGEAQ